MKSKWIKKLVTYYLVLVLILTNGGYIQAGTEANREECIKTTQIDEIVAMEQVVSSVQSLSGSGVEEDPYLINDVEDLRNISENLSGYYKLTGDINLNGTEWVPVGTQKKPFKGHLDGNGYTISNFEISGSESFTGFFGYLRNAVVSNLSLKDFQVSGICYVGGLAGCAQGVGTLISNCHIPAGTISGVNEIGGLIGYGNSITITECTSYAVVSSTDSTVDSNIGGILGYNYKASVNKCCYSGEVLSVGANAGGLAGFSYIGAYEECYSDGKIIGTNYVGGLVGNFGTVGTILNCFALGEVIGERYVGGISAYKGDITNSYFAGKITGEETVYGMGYNTSVTNCYFDITINILSTSTSLGRTTDEMQKQATFIDWDFQNVWKIVEGQSYPYLKELVMPDAIRSQIAIVTMNGSLINGKTGVAISGASVIVHYVDYKGESIIYDTVTTNTSGVFKIENAVLGETYTLEIAADGYVSKEITVVCTGEVITVGTIVIIPVTSANIMTIILTWGANPSDLDTHFSGNGYHVYYSSKTASGAVLDLDDTSSYGPETLTLDTSILPVGTYSYYVHWYYGSGTWSTSGANVEVYLGNDYINSFHVPSTLTGSSGQWNVFNIAIANNPNSVSSIDKHTVSLVY